jgi:ribosomal protein S18 acetylase RimI-like enzyme
MDIRPMSPSDVADAARVFEDAFDALRIQLNLPAIPANPERHRRLQRRMTHFLATDPTGSFVAVQDGDVVGLSQGLLRDGFFVLSLLGVAPRCQERRVGSQLLQQALELADPDGPAMILCSRDPRAMALYRRAGFELHPAITASGPRRPTPRPEGIRIGDSTDVPVVSAIDRDVRGAARPRDLEFLLSEPGHRLLLDGEQGYAVATDDRVIVLGARDTTSARRVLLAALADMTAEVAEVPWVTGAQQWAFEVVTEAAIALHPHGPVMTRGLSGPLSPYLPSGGYG